MTLISTSDRIAIFGGRGMAGSAISRALERAGYFEQLKPSRNDLDLLDPLAVQQWFAVHHPTVVILAAAKVGGIHANNTFPSDFLLENLKIQTHVIETAWRSGVRRLLFLGSSCIYPKFAEQPIKEEALLTGVLEPTNEWYAIAKIAGIKLCEALRQQHGFDAICLMPTNLYGPGDNYHPVNSHVLPALISRFYEAVSINSKTVTCWGSGNPLREFLHVDDLGEACVFVLENWKPRLGDRSFLNVGSGEELSIRELAKTVADALGFKGRIEWDTSKPDGTPKKSLNTGGLSSLGWNARIPLKEGLISVIHSYKKQLTDCNLRA